jgi:DNA-directed RNA polymerase subunit beta'
MGHIELAAPVAHIWFLKSLPSRIGLLLDMTLKDLERVLYFENYIVTEPGLTPLKSTSFSPKKTTCCQDEYGEDAFTAMIGAEAIREMLMSMDLEKIAGELRQEIAEDNFGTEAEEARQAPEGRRSFMESGNRPEWMIMKVVPVIPPDLRPLVPLDGGRFRNLGPQRSLPPRDQPQQPSEAPDGTACAGHHHPQRKADAAGSPLTRCSTTAAAAASSPAPTSVR